MAPEDSTIKVAAEMGMFLLHLVIFLNVDLCWVTINMFTILNHHHSQIEELYSC